MDEDNGRTYTFKRAELDRPGQRFFIGAVPCGRDVPEPQSFAPGLRAGVPWLGMKVTELNALDRVLLIGSNVRKEHPLLAQPPPEKRRH